MANSSLRRRAATATEDATAADITTRTVNAATRAKATAKDAATKEAKDAATTMNR